MSEVYIMQCDSCGKTVTTCDWCKEQFDEDDDVVCLEGYHFDDLDCAVYQLEGKFGTIRLELDKDSSGVVDDGQKEGDLK